MDANKDESIVCLERSRKFYEQKRIVKAIKFAQKSISLYPNTEAENFLNKLKAEYKAYYKKDFESNSSNSSNSNNSNNNNSSNSNNMNNNNNIRREGNSNSENNSNNLNENRNLNTSYSSVNIPQNIVEIDTSFLDNGNNNNNNNNSNNNNNNNSNSNGIFSGLESHIRPILPESMQNFKIHRDWEKIIVILFVVFLALLLLRFIWFGHPIGYPPININNNNKQHSYSSSGSGTTRGTRNTGSYTSGNSYTDGYTNSGNSGNSGSDRFGDSSGNNDYANSQRSRNRRNDYGGPRSKYDKYGRQDYYNDYYNDYSYQRPRGRSWTFTPFGAMYSSGGGGGMLDFLFNPFVLMFFVLPMIQRFLNNRRG